MDSFENVINGALELEDPEERARFLDSACKGDSELRSRIEGALSELGLAETFFGNRFRDVREEVVEADPSISGEGEGSMVGRYKLIRRIGEGGFGVVYLAEQLEPVRREVALKVIKLGMDTREVIARFEAERQALAMMDHPNIAKVLEAGSTDSGRPYFVMELVEGVPLTAYCDENRCSTRQRLELFTDVCLAVQHAHQKGIIHRDLKPSNILVAEVAKASDGRNFSQVPLLKIIDFGIAKATEQHLTDKTLFTRAGQFVGTPVYTSPEQTASSSIDIDTRSDIYSLGVVLYELLTGRTPFGGGNSQPERDDEMRRKIREEDPPKPSTRVSSIGDAETAELADRRAVEPPGRLRGQLRGDLDWIVMKALEKDRTRRYQTANALAIDINRHLENQPVSAAAPGTIYQLKKFVRRNKALVSGVAAVFAVLLVGILGMIFLYFEVKEREKETRQNLYAADMYAASRSLQVENAFLRVRDFLREHIPEKGQEDLRGFEWRLYWALSASNQIRTLSGHTSRVHGVAFSPGGTLLASMDWDGNVRLWNTGSFSLASAMHIADENTGSIAPVNVYSEGNTTDDSSPASDVSPMSLGGPDPSDLSFSFDDRYFALVLTRGSIILYDVSDPANPRRIREIPGVRHYHFSPNEPVLALAGDTGLRLWNYENNESHSVTEWRAALPTFVRSGNHIAYLEVLDNTVRMVSTLNGDHGKSVKLKREAKVLREPVRIVVDSAGEKLAAHQPWGVLDLYDLVGGGTETSFGSCKHVRDAAFSPDGQLLAVSAGDDQTVRLYDLKLQREIATYRGHEHGVPCVAFSPDGEVLASGGADNRVMVWDSTAGRLGQSISGRYVVFHPEKRLCLVARGPVPAASLFDTRTHSVQWTADGEIPLGFIDSGRSVLTLTSSLEAGKRSPDRMPVLREGAVEGDVYILQATLNDRLDIPPLIVDGYFGPGTNRAVLEFQKGNALEEANKVGPETWKALEPLIDIPVTDTICRRDLAGRETGPRIRLESYPDARGAEARLSPDGSRIVGLFPAGRIGVWDARSGEHLHRITIPFAKLRPTYPSFSPDGRFFAAGVDGVKTIRIWDLHTGREAGRFEGHRNTVPNLAFAPDGKGVATSSWNGTVRLWNRETGAPLVTFKGAIGNRVAYTPDGQTLASGGEQGKVRFWNVATGREVGDFFTNQGFLDFIAFSPDGEILATKNRDPPHSIRFWHAPAVEDPD